MQFKDLVTALMDAKRKAQIEGRPLSAEEAQGLSAAWFNTAQDREIQGRQITTAEDSLAHERWKTQKMIEVANDSSRNQIWNNLIKTGGSLYGYNALLRGNKNELY
jgi:hypothetical protein